MIRAQKEIIWHLTCSSCSHYWTFPIMEEKYRIDRATFHCPACGKKCRVELQEEDG